MLKSDLESLANKYGLTLPTKLKRGKLIFELKTPNNTREVRSLPIHRVTKNSYSLSSEEVQAIECAF